MNARQDADADLFFLLVVIFQILIKKAHGSVRGSSPDSFHFTEDGEFARRTGVTSHRL